MASPILGPITRVPYDIITEIFVHCLPQHRLKHRQPNTTIAPILLCHICSTWRTAALATPTLWSHLHYCLTVGAERNKFEDGDWILRKNQYAFLMWWKNNQGSIAPFLCLDLDWKDRYEFDSDTDSSEPKLDAESELELDGAGMISLFRYISSAQHIETDELFWFMIGEWVGKLGYSIRYPVPRTLIQSEWTGYFDDFYQDQLALVPNRSPSALRHLYCSGQIRLHTLDIPKHWSSLTHVALLVSSMSLPYWHTLIRAVPQLQLGRFRIEVLDDDDYDEPTPCTLAELSTLFITVDQMNDISELGFSFGMLFAALHLPALRDLSLSSKEAWYDHRALSHIYSALDAARAITTLTLGPSFLALDYDEEYLTRTLPLINDIEPLWSRAPYLVHLRLMAVSSFGSRFQEITKQRRDTLVRNLFHHDNRWLCLHDVACPIRTLTIIDDSKQPEHSEEDSEDEYQDRDRIADYTRSCIREHAERSPNIKTVFDVIFETQDQVIAGAWNEWGPNL
jgi:hypothetical protein